MSAEPLAQRAATHAPSLYRLRRTLASLRILTEDGAHRFALTPLGEALQTDAPGSARATILTFASDWRMRGFAQLLYSVQTGKPGFEKHLPAGLGGPLNQTLKKGRYTPDSGGCRHTSLSTG